MEDSHILSDLLSLTESISISGFNSQKKHIQSPPASFDLTPFPSPPLSEISDSSMTPFTPHEPLHEENKDVRDFLGIFGSNLNQLQDENKRLLISYNSDYDAFENISNQTTISSLASNSTSSSFFSSASSSSSLGRQFLPNHFKSSSSDNLSLPPSFVSPTPNTHFQSFKTPSLPGTSRKSSRSLWSHKTSSALRELSELSAAFFTTGWQMSKTDFAKALLSVMKAESRIPK